MACLYHKNRSPYWYIQCLDSNRKKHDKSAGFRAGGPNDTIKAKILRAELEAKGHRRAPVVNGAAWDSWVPKFFARHCETKKTFDRYEGAWKIDQREKVEDLVQWRDAVQFPTGSSDEMSSRFHTAASIEK